MIRPFFIFNRDYALNFVKISVTKKTGLRPKAFGVFMSDIIYLDHHATTPVDSRVFNAMKPYFCEKFGNASSRYHSFGIEALQATEIARGEVANLINANPEEIIFTGSASESNNLAILGAARAYRGKGNHVIVSAIEHSSVRQSALALENEGFRVSFAPVDRQGFIQMDELKALIDADTILVSVIAASNEVGVIQDLQRIGELTRSKEVIFHTDASQLAGREAIDVQACHIDLLSLAAHKMYGPKGIGALFVRQARPRIRLEPLMHGGGQENELRPGSLNVAGIVGFGEACRIARDEMESEKVRISSLKKKLRERLFSALDEIYLNGPEEKRLAGNLNISFAYIEAESLMQSLQDKVAVSSGSACSSGQAEPPYVLKAMGVPERLAHTAIRIGIGRFNTLDEIEIAADLLINNVKEMRLDSPLYEMAKSGEILGGVEK